MQRILFVIEDLLPMGPVQQLKLLADELIVKHYEIHIAVLGQKAFVPKDWLDPNIDVYFLNGDDKTPLHTMRDGFQVIAELRQLIRSIKPEIIHSWCGQAELLMLLAIQQYPFTKRLRRIRLISTELYLQPSKRFFRQTLENKMARRIERMIVPHESVKQHLVENGYRESRIAIVPNAVTSSLPLIRTEAKSELTSMLGVSEDANIAGTVAPLQHRTRLKDLIWATELLTCIRDDFHLLIIGTGTQLKQLQHFAGLTQSKSHVHFLGQPDNLETIIAGLDFYWNSHLQEPNPTSLLNAMSSGVPAISVLGAGTNSIIRHQETGFAVNFGARDEFARWTKYLIEQTESGEQLADQGQQHVQTKFNKSKMVDGYVEIYELND